MDSATILTIILVLVAMAVGLVTFGLLRERDRGAVISGCAAIGAGLLIVVCFVLFQIIRLVN